MDLSNGKAAFAMRLQQDVLALSSDHQANGHSVLAAMQILAGVVVESVFLFDEPDSVLQATLQKCARLLNDKPFAGELPAWCWLDPGQLDWRAEQGRQIARMIIDEWQECHFSYIDFITFAVHNFLVQWAENYDFPRHESLRMLEEAAFRALAFEIAAQELCLEVIDQKMTDDGWSIADCLCGLSAYAGRTLGVSLESQEGPAADHPVDLLMHVMAQESARLGVPAGTPWYLGIAANDLPPDPPHDLMAGVRPICDRFFEEIQMSEPLYQAVAAAKAAGRMLAVVASGEMPDIPPEIAKPLAVMAMSETYRSLQPFLPKLPPSRQRPDRLRG